MAEARWATGERAYLTRRSTAPTLLIPTAASKRPSATADSRHLAPFTESVVLSALLSGCQIKGLELCRVIGAKTRARLRRW